MTHSLYAIGSASGFLRSAHPEGGVVAHLYHDEGLAQEQINNLQQPEQWKIIPVQNLEEWLAALDRLGFSHVYEVLTKGINKDTLSTMHEISFWQTSLEAVRVGRTLR
jgi:hypothetical protein